MFKPEDIEGYITKPKLEAILEEIAGLSITLEEDPTLPDLGYRYLQSRLAKCRDYLNRTQYYHQITRRYQKNLQSRIRHCELDLDFKVMEKLADDGLVRRERSIEDRKALAMSMMKEEYQELSILKVELLNLEETVKLVKLKYDDLSRTNNDVKLQRQMVRDDRNSELGEGYSPPQASQNKTVGGGLPPAVRAKKIDPTEILDPNRRPDDIPQPINQSHARQIASFFNGLPAQKPLSEAIGSDPGSQALPEASNVPEVKGGAPTAIPTEPAQSTPVPTPISPAKPFQQVNYDDLLAD